MKSELQNVSITYIEESKKKFKVSRGWTQSWNEWQCRLRGKTACRNHWPRPIHPNYASILETDVKTNNKRLLLESLYSFLYKNSVNEWAPLSRVYASLVSSMRGNEHWRFCYIFAFRDLQSTFLWRRPQKAVENSVLNRLDLFKLHF